MARVAQPTSAAEAESILRSTSVVANFCAAWAEPCAHLNTVFAELSTEHTHLTFVQVGQRFAPKLSCTDHLLHTLHVHTCAGAQGRAHEDAH